jgi:hypothetical protein
MAFTYMKHSCRNMPPMIRVGRRSAGNVTDGITGYNGIIGSTADSFVGAQFFRDNPAWTLQANPAANTGIAKITTGLLGFGPVKTGQESYFFRFDEHFPRGGVDCAFFKFRHSSTSPNCW